MSTKYKATMSATGYFITITTVGSVDIFARLRQKYVISSARNYASLDNELEV